MSGARNADSSYHLLRAGALDGVESLLQQLLQATHAPGEDDKQIRGIHVTLRRRSRLSGRLERRQVVKGHDTRGLRTLRHAAALRGGRAARRCPAARRPKQLEREKGPQTNFCTHGSLGNCIEATIYLLRNYPCPPAASRRIIER